MVTTAELIFWIVAGLIALSTLIIVPMIGNCMDSKEVERMFSRPNTNIDDMEDKRR